MKSKISSIIIALFICINQSLCGQAKKPSIIILPSMDWCQMNGFVKTEEVFGEKKVIPDYEAALRTRPLLKDVLSLISDDMRNAGFPPKMLEKEMQNVERRRTQDQIRRSKTGGAITKTSIQILREVAKADIEFQIHWEIESNGPRWRISRYRLEGFDSYTSKPCGSAMGQGDWAFKNDVTESQLLTDAIASAMDGFKAKLQTHFDDLFINGREIVLFVQTTDNWSKDLQTREFGGKREQLTTIIQNWVRANTVKGRFDSPLITETSMDFSGVRIPLYDVNGYAMDGLMFANNLQEYLIGIGLSDMEIDVSNYGLGEVTIIFGPK
jgi:hypothetical protein